MAATTIAGIGLAIAAAGTSYSVYSQNEAADKADAAQEKATKDQQALLDEQKKQTDLQKASMDKAQNDTLNLTDRNSAASRMRALAMNAQGRSSTILTGPLGVPNSGAGGARSAPGKTLLGV